jgi:hypothetical protein
VNEAAGQSRGLACTRTGQNELDASGSGCGVLLCWVEGVHLHDRAVYDFKAAVISSGMR